MKKTTAKILLLSAFMSRGTSFIFLKYLLGTMSPLSIIAVRFTTAFLVLAVIFHNKLLQCSKKTLIHGIILGTLYTIVMTFELNGLKYIESGVSSLIENMAIILVPIYIAIFTRTLPKKKTILCAILAVVGVGFLTITQINLAGGEKGIILTICAALTYAGCIILTGKFVKNDDPISLGIIQIGAESILSLIIVFSSRSIVLPQGGQQWLMLLFLAVICTCYGFTVQPIGQRVLPAETAAVFTVSNPLTASILGIIIAGDSISIAKIIGYIIILTTLIIYNLDMHRNT